MAADVIRLDIVTPAGIVFSDKVSAVMLPATRGLMTVLANHAPLMTTLSVGPVKYTQDDTEHFLAVSGGFLEVNTNLVTILANSAERAEDIDLARAINAKERAEERISSANTDVDLIRAEMALKRSMNRINIFGNKK